MFVLRDLDGLEIACSRDVCHFSPGHGALFVGQSRRLMILGVQDGEVGGPPRFCVVGRS